MLTYKGKQVYDIFKGDVFRVIRTRRGEPSSEASEVEYTCLDSMQSNNGFFKAKDDSGIGPYNFNTVEDDLEIISRANPRNERLAKNRPMKLMIRESTDRFINDPSSKESKSRIRKRSIIEDSVIIESNTKMKDVKVLQGCYGRGWEDLEEVDADDIQGVKELKNDLKSYDENERKYIHRIITRKVQNPNYDPTKARKSRDHGVMVTVANDYAGMTKEVYFTEDESVLDDLNNSDMIYKTNWNYRSELSKDGYEYVKRNFRKLSDDEYEFKKRYSYYTYFLSDGTKPKTILPVFVLRYDI